MFSRRSQEDFLNLSELKVTSLFGALLVHVYPLHPPLNLLYPLLKIGEDNLFPGSQQVLIINAPANCIIIKALYKSLTVQYISSKISANYVRQRVNSDNNSCKSNADPVDMQNSYFL